MNLQTLILTIELQIVLLFLFLSIGGFLLHIIGSPFRLIEMGQRAAFVPTGQIVHDDATDFAGTFTNMEDYTDKLTVYTENDLANGLCVVHFNEGAGLEADDASAKDRDFILNSATAWSLGDGKALTNCIDFGGSNVKRMTWEAGDADFNCAAGTIEFWVKLNTGWEPGRPADQWLCEEANGWIQGRFLCTTGKLGMLTWHDGAPIWLYTDLTTTWVAGRWYHIAKTWGPAGVKLYVNGVLQSSNANVNAIQGMSGAQTWGCRSDLTLPLDGHIEEFKYSNVQKSTFNLGGGNGAYTSQTIDVGASVEWGTISWTAVADGATIVVQVNTSPDNVDWTESKQTVNSGDYITGNNRYLRYYITITSATVNTSITNITITYSV